MVEDWPAVGSALKERRGELRISQTKLEELSGICVSTIGELEKGTVRQRAQHTLSRLSEALGWHPGHLDAVLKREKPPTLVTAHSHDIDLAALFDERFKTVKMLLDDVLRHEQRNEEKLDSIIDTLARRQDPPAPRRR